MGIKVVDDTVLGGLGRGWLWLWLDISALHNSSR